MELIPAFDPTMATSGEFTASTLQTGSQMIISNKSYVNMIFTFSSGDQRIVIANDRRAFTFAGATALPGPIIKWEQQSIDYPQTINQLENLVFVEIYAPTEIVSEKYPSVIQRETLPTLVPYDIGYTSTGLFSITSNTPFPVIWPSSYYGVTVAPTAVQGMNFDHFWSDTFVAQSTTMFDVPGSFPSTGKTANNATLITPSLASNIPGPFSKPGLTPVDSTTHLNGTHWECASTINWAGATSGFYLDFWLNLDNINATQYVFGDSSPDTTNSGVAVHIDSQNMVVFDIGLVGGFKRVISSGLIVANTWYHIACQYTGTTNNTMTIYINGVQDNTMVTSGAPVNTTRVPWIGGNNFHGNSIFGSVCNIGILLSNINATQWGASAIPARYELGLQSLDVNMQKVWITGVDFTAFANVTSTAYSTILLDNIYNPAGLLYVDNSANTDPLHIINPFGNTLQWRFPAITANTINVQNFKPTNPITHLPLGFPQFIVSSLATNTELDLVVHGFNILGIK